MTYQSVRTINQAVLAAVGPHLRLKRWALVLFTLAVSGSLMASTAIGAPPNQADETGAGKAYAWGVERVDAPHFFYNMGDHSIRVDSLGYSHVAYGGDHLYYAHFNGLAWVVEIVDDNFGVGQYTSLVLDKLNHPHISYYDAYRGRLKYARYDGTRWIIEVIDESPSAGALATEELPPDEGDLENPFQFDRRDWLNPLLAADSGGNLGATAIDESSGVGLFTSIALDSSGRPRISYYDAVNSKLKYAAFDGLEWDIHTVVEPPLNKREGKYSSLAIDSRDHAHISYLDERLDALGYVEIVGDSWDFATVDDSDNVGAFTSIALDRSGRPRISYAAFNSDTDRYELRYAFRDNDRNWDFVAVDSTNNVGWWSSLAIDSDGTAHISYFDITNGDLRYATGSGANWDRSTLASSGDAGRYSSIALDGNENPRISYLDYDNGLYREAYISGNNWAARNIDDHRDVGLASSLGLDSADTPFISYLNDTTDDLKLAQRTDGFWAVDVLLSPGYVGIYSSLAMDSLGQPRIAFYDSTNGDLKYAFWTGKEWSIQTVDFGGVDNYDVGRYPSLALDAANTPYISYYDATNGDLRYTYWNGLTWSIVPIDGHIHGEDVGQYTSLVLDSLGRPHISYYDAYNGNLKYIYWNGNFWIGADQYVDIGGDVGKYNSLVLDRNNTPWISYYDASNGDLKYATLAGGAWVAAAIDTADDVGLYTSIDLDLSDFPHISYYDATNGNLKFAYLTPTQWITQTVESLGQVGLSTSLEIDSQGNPHISYYDATNGDLKFASGFVLSTQVFLPSLFLDQ